MFRVLRRQGVVLAKKEFGLDLIIFFLTSRGIIRVKAKSALKPRAKLKNLTETFDFVSYELIDGKKNFILIGGKLIKRPLYLRKNLEKTLLLKAIAEIALTIVKGEETKKIYLLWLYALRALKNIKEKNLLAFFSFFLIHLLAIEGLINPFQETGLIKDLYTMPFSILQKKSFQDKDYRKIILSLRTRLISERHQLRTMDLFLKNI